MRATIVDCYTDEPSGLGVMPYIGTYPRYLFGALDMAGVETFYLTIDDLRAAVRGTTDLEQAMRTPIATRNITPSAPVAHKALASSDVVFVIAGVHSPGKYLSAYPGTSKEAHALLLQLDVRGRTVLTGPAALGGSGLWGGKRARSTSTDTALYDLVVAHVEFKVAELMMNGFFDDVDVAIGYDALRDIAVRGAGIVSHLPHDLRFHIAEVETMSGCQKNPPCSFCTEHLKSPEVSRRPARDIVDEVRALSRAGLRNVRLGKQTCIYSYGSYQQLATLLKSLSPLCDVLHVDNANPLYVTEDKTKALVAYCSPGNVASLGVESFDPVVIDRNDLSTSPEVIMDAIRIINRYGARRGANGMPSFLPGINLLFGLMGESRRTHEENLSSLRAVYDEGLMLRRINIREVVVFPGTRLERECGLKYLKKNRKRYWKWRSEVRHEIDLPMLRRIVPTGTSISGVRTEIYDGKTTFGRQVGTYPLVVGIKGRIGLDRCVDVAVTDHMLRSVTGVERAVGDGYGTYDSSHTLS